jgi:hypothetical protein
MRDVFYTREEIENARQTWAPRLREYANHCRIERPVPALNSLSVAEREQWRILRAKMQAFTPYSPFRREHVAILHSTPVGLLAAQEVFGPVAECMVFLLANEKVKWFDNIYPGVDGWYWFLWWTIHDRVPQRFADAVATHYPTPHGFAYWVVTEGRGAGDASHEVWKWDGAVAEPVEVFWQVYAEEGFVEEWYE